MSSFSIALSGLSASSNALNIISNDLANLNTVGYKDQQANFEDLFYQNLGTNGSGDPIQEGMGTTIGSTSTNFSDGTVQSTGVPSNVAITGNGFFISQDPNGVYHYTRSGDFSTDSNGDLITSSGDTVLGYPAVNGVVNSGAALGPLQVGTNVVSPPSATTTISQQTNLDATAAVGTNYSTPLTVYDSLGASHILTFNFTQTAANNWSYQITMPAADTGGTGNPTVVSSGNLTFDGNGNLTSPTGSVTGISVAGLTDGAATMNLTWNLANNSGGSLITQVASPSTTSETSQDGFRRGNTAELHGRERRHHRRLIHQRADASSGSDRPGELLQCAGPGGRRRKRLRSHARLGRSGGRSPECRRPWHSYRRRARNVERRHLHRIHPAHRDPARVRSQCSNDHDARFDRQHDHQLASAARQLTDSVSG